MTMQGVRNKITLYSEILMFKKQKLKKSCSKQLNDKCI